MLAGRSDIARASALPGSIRNTAEGLIHGRSQLEIQQRQSHATYRTCRDEPAMDEKPLEKIPGSYAFVRAHSLDSVGLPIGDGDRVEALDLS